MNVLATAVDFFLHLDTHLQEIIANYGPLTYAILFLIIFAETGLVVAPFLPGDSLLFAAGTFAGTGSLDLILLLILFLVAAIGGDAVNYHIGRYVGPKVFKEHHRFLNHEKLMAAEQFYEKHGGKAIILARFIPIMRTFAPFVAGIGKMKYADFAYYNCSLRFLDSSLATFLLCVKTLST